MLASVASLQSNRKTNPLFSTSLVILILDKVHTEKRQSQIPKCECSKLLLLFSFGCLKSIELDSNPSDLQCWVDRCCMLGNCNPLPPSWIYDCSGTAHLQRQRKGTVSTE